MATTHDPADDSQHPDRADPAEPKGRMLDAAQVAEILGGSYTAGTVVRRYRHWELTAFRVGRELRWWEADVYEWIKNRRVN
jgi:predicted DNA-binding transcriptional regulator AlpA